MFAQAADVKKKLMALQRLSKPRSSRHAAAVASKPAAAPSPLPPKPAAPSRSRQKPALEQAIEIIVLSDDETDLDSDSDSDVEIVRFTRVEHKKCEVIKLLSDSEDKDEQARPDEQIGAFAREDTPPPAYDDAVRQAPVTPIANPQPGLLQPQELHDPIKLRVPRKRIRGNKSPHPWPNEPSKYRYPMTLAKLPALPPLPPQWTIVDGKIRWNRSHDNFLLHARLGDARLKHLVFFVLRLAYRRPLLSKRTVTHFLTNQVLGVLAFAYHIEFRSTLDTLHTYADAMEAFIETVFHGENDNGNNTDALEWLAALWSPAHFPLLEKDLENSIAPIDLHRCWNLWQNKRSRWLPCA